MGKPYHACVHDVRKPETKKFISKPVWNKGDPTAPAEVRAEPPWRDISMTQVWWAPPDNCPAGTNWNRAIE